VGDVKKLTAFQERMIEVIDKRPNRMASTSELAERLRTSRLAVTSAGRSLEAAGHVVSFRSGRDQWAVLMWSRATKPMPEVRHAG
jgi:DNA-binding MarR family transcriptional regulator